MIAKLKKARDLFQKTDDLIGEMVKPLSRRYGLTKEALNRVYEEHVAEALKRANG